MKKQLKEELIALGEKIMLLKQQEVKSGELKELARQLYEKLAILDFTERNLAGSLENEAAESKPDAQKQEVEAKKENLSSKEEVSQESRKVSEPKAKEKNQEEGQEKEEDDEFAPTGMEYNTSEAITEPNTEKIKDIVAQMPPETQKLDEMLEHILPGKKQKNDMEEIGGIHFDNLPEFEPVSSSTPEPEKPKSLNDRLKKGIQIGLNDRHAFIRHLFGGSTADYNRVLSQLNTIKSKDEALNFVLNMVKPDYNNWEGKEECETRFLNIIENKFQ